MGDMGGFTINMGDSDNINIISFVVMDGMEGEDSDSDQMFGDFNDLGNFDLDDFEVQGFGG